MKGYRKIDRHIDIWTDDPSLSLYQRGVQQAGLRARVLALEVELAGAKVPTLSLSLALSSVCLAISLSHSI